MAEYPVVIGGFPKGSLNRSSRGSAAALLYGAGFNLGGTYCPDMPDNDIGAIRLVNFPRVVGIGFDSQTGPGRLYTGEADFAIYGDDWAREFELKGMPTKRLAGLPFGGVNVVVGVKEDVMDKLGELSDGPTEEIENLYEALMRMAEREGRPLVGAAELPKIAADHVMSTRAFKNRYPGMTVTEMSPSGGTVTNGGATPLYVVRHVISQAESQLEMGPHSADYIIDCTQTRSSFRKKEIAVASRIMPSEASVRTTEIAMADEYKANIIDFMAWMLSKSKLTYDEPDLDDSYKIAANVLRHRVTTIVQMSLDKGYCDKRPNITPEAGDRKYIELGMRMPVEKWPEFAFDAWNLSKRFFKEDGEPAIDDIERHVTQSLTMAGFGPFNKPAAATKADR